MHIIARLIAASFLAIAAQAASSLPPYFPPPGFGPPTPSTGYQHRSTAALGRPLRPAHPTWRLPHAGMRPQGAAHRHPAATSAAQPQTATEPASGENLGPNTAPADSGQSRTPDSQRAFIQGLQPLIEQENRQLLELRDRLRGMFARLDADRPLSDTQRKQLTSLARKYRVEGDPQHDPEARAALLQKVDAMPASMALAQAANESAWGKSRFAREGNNLFGIWTYDESKGIVPLNRSPGKKHLVRRFDSLAESVRYYLLTLNSHPAYAELRAIRSALRAAGEPLDGLTMAQGLTKYSAKGTEYVRIIQDMIRRFDLAAYDAAPANRA